MKRPFLLTLFAGIVCLSYAGKYSPNGALALNKRQFAFNDSLGDPNLQSVIAGLNSDDIPTMNEMFILLRQVTGYPNEFELREGNVMNLEASISHRKKIITYNPAFIESLNLASGDKWSSLTLLAHEIGHHVKGHTRHRAKDRLKAELEADEFAGYVLAKMGASLEDAQKVMLFVAKPVASATHPDRFSRMDAIKKGWDNFNN